MSLSLKRIYAIFLKDLKDLSKNLYVSSIVILPLFFAIMYSRIDQPTIEIHYLIINLTLVSITATIQCAVIAEEKEKNTLRGLMLSPATVLEILTGKSFVSLVLTAVTILVCMNITGYMPENTVFVLIAILLSCVFYLGLGTLLGLVTRTVVEASVIIMPFLFLFGFGSQLQGLTDQYSILAFVNYMPNTQLIEFAHKVEDGLGFADLWSHLLIILAWGVAIGILTIGVYRKREMDE
ncbi:ABC-2 type transport system permease protein [Oceanobacillus limi]|uniref:ABC-2 type transport system permease protein n=1 Tax=Oceanobacillus limi TaxID=930131 RepID=A0A1I0B3L6_9BACI|nr:ABC transporter permease [Oceanobacillus limi]SET00551.1 ABC-2 type transport system permease protein [Oceanobacillus limi]